MKFSKEERIIHTLKPQTRLIVIWFFTKCVTHGFATAFFPAFIWWGYATFSNLSERIFVQEYGFFVLMGVIMFVLGALLSYVYNRYLIASITYFVTDRRCVWKGGIVRKVEHTVSYHKITDVERSRNLLEQILGLSTINLFTPGTSSMRMGAGARSQAIPELRFEGLQKSEEASETINEQVRKYGAVQP